MSVHLSLDQIARALGGRVIKNSDGSRSVSAPAPGHSRRDDSLSVKLGDKGQIIVNSFAGEDWRKLRDYVHDRIGIPSWQPKQGDTAEHIINRMADRARNASSCEERASSSANGHAAEAARDVAFYDYKDQTGRLIYQTVRREPKDFRQRRPDPDRPGQWLWNLHGITRLPYRLPELLAAAAHDIVFVVEGEKDVDALVARSFVATCNSEGSGKWKPDLNGWLAGKSVFILADNDEPGAKHARQVAENLTDVASDVRIVNLPGLPPKGDVSDWLDAGGKTSELVELCKSFPIFAKPHAKAGAFTASDLQGMTLPPIKWIVPGYLVEGLTLLAGKPKLGKSWLVMHVAIAVARGGFTFGSVHCIEGDVLYCALEDNKRRLQRRMRKLLGADPWPARLEFTCDMPRLKSGGVEYVRHWIEAAGEPRLVIIDTLQKVRDPKGMQESGYESDYAAVSQLKALADEKGVAIVLIHHVRKMAADDPLDTVSGTTGLTGAVDSVLVLSRDGQGVTLHGAGRDIEAIEDAIEFDKVTCLWRVTGKAEEVRRSDERTAILEVLKKANGEAMSHREITDMCGMAYDAGRKTIARMAGAGEIERAGRGRFKLDPLSNPLSQMSQSPDEREEGEELGTGD